MSSNSTLHVRTWSRAEPDAPSALLLHGLASSSRTWVKLAKDLYKLGFTVYAPDLHGHGRSPRLATYTLNDWHDAIIDLNLNPDLIVGHSMGGLLAAKIQETYNATNLVLLDPVFHLPKNSFLKKSVRTGFTTVMLFTKFQTIPNIKKYLSPQKNISLLNESINVHRWDIKSAALLNPDPAVIVKRLLKGEENILLIRAKGSYVLPNYILKKKFRSGVTVTQANVGHNLHHENYDHFWVQIKDFLKEKI